MTLDHFGLAVILAINVVYALAYRHHERRYADGKRDRIPSTESFRWFYLWLRVSTPILAILALGGWRPYALALDLPVGARVAGIAVSVAAAVLFLASKGALGRQYSPCFDSFAPSTIVTAGPYCWVRHPIYTANIALFAGFTLITGSAVLLAHAFVLAAYCRRAARLEDEHLGARFPAYAARLEVTGRFLPRIAAQG